MSSADFDTWMRDELLAVERALEDWVPLDTPAGLGVAMRYGVLDGGKRLRPLLVLAAAQAVGANAIWGREAALRAAIACELIHAYSLVHDDMPCMDDDVLRRGKPTVHVRYGEAQAMLAGDAMQALAFEVLTPERSVPRASAGAARQPARARLRPRRHGRRPGDRPGEHRAAARRSAARGHAPAQDRRAAAGQRADGRVVRRHDQRRLAALGRLRRGRRPRIPGRRRHPRRDAGRPRRSARPPARTRAPTSPPMSACSASASRANAPMRCATTRIAHWRRAACRMPPGFRCWPTRSSIVTAELEQHEACSALIDSPADLRRLVAR